LQGVQRTGFWLKIGQSYQRGKLVGMCAFVEDEQIWFVPAIYQSTLSMRNTSSCGLSGTALVRHASNKSAETYKASKNNLENMDEMQE
jgi:hypothetical protein